MNEQQSQAEYEHRMATDPAFRAIQEQLDYCYAMDGRVRRPYWENWTGTRCGAKTKSKTAQGGLKPRAAPIAPRPIICVQTGEMYVSIGSLARLLDIAVTTLKGYVKAERPRHGKIYRYATEAEKGQL